MKVLLKAERKKDTVAMRDIYGKTLMDMAAQDERVVVLDADLMASMGTIPFREAYPERTFDCGIQEANMVGTAAGLSATGLIPFAHTFGAFASRRACDQMYLAAGYSGLNVRLVGSDPGITAAFNGGTHMALEDMGIFRTLPGATILEPVDNVMLENLLRQVKDLYGVFYIRLLRKEPITIYEKGTEFTIGKGIVLRDGSDVTMFTSGVLVSETLDAAEELAAQGISARVVNLFTWKPIDAELICQCACETGAVVTVENHSITNGLGSAVAEVLVEHEPVPMERVGCPERFGEVGPQDYLMKALCMSKEFIVEKAMRAVARKMEAASR